MNDETVSETGEFALIARLRDSLPSAVKSSESLLVGIGDDTAVWQPSPGERLLVTTDAMIEGVHFDLDWTSWRDLGWKSLAVNVSDIASMGGLPRLAVVSLGLRPELPVTGILECYGGLAEMAERSGVVIAGGDVVSSPAAMMVSVTLLGETRGGQFLTRSGAQPGDAIAISGYVGAAAAGVRLHQLPGSDPRRDAATAPALFEALHRPFPRLELGPRLLELGATSAMDLSDGLAGDLVKIVEASGVSAEVESTTIPVPAAVRALFPDNWLDLAISGGEDYELLFTAPPGALPVIVETSNQLGLTITRIGTVLEPDPQQNRVTLIDATGERKPMPSGGWDHFRRG